MIPRLLVRCRAYLLPLLIAGTCLGTAWAAQPLVAARSTALDTPIAQGKEYMAATFGATWEMSTIEEIYNEKSHAIQHGGTPDRMTVENGLLVGTTVSDDGYFFLIWPGFPDTQNLLPRYGINNPVDTTRYRYLVVRMYLSQAHAADYAQVFWGRGLHLDTQWGISNPIQVYQGWHTYLIDLQTVGRADGNLDWSGLIHTLRFDPTNRAGVEVKVDWVRLVDTTGIASHQATWPERQGLLSLYALSEPATIHTELLLAEKLRAAQGSYTWWPGLLTAGDYYLYRLHYNDYARMALNNPWDMDSQQDIIHTGPLAANVTFRDGLMIGSTANPIGWVYFTVNSDDLVDANLFKRFTVRMRVSGHRDTATWGLVWYRKDAVTTPHQIADQPIAADEEWHTYSVDLSVYPEWRETLNLVAMVLAKGAGPNATIEVDWASLSVDAAPAAEADLARTGAVSPERLQVRAAPVARITSPSYASGADYATTLFNDPWDFENPQDVLGSLHLDSLIIAGGVATYETDGYVIPVEGGVKTGDPRLILRTGAYFLDSRTPIDPLRYRYFSYRFQENVRQDTTEGSVHRLFFGDNGSAKPFASTTRDAVTNEGLRTYQMDLNSAQVQIGTPWTSYRQIDTFGFDPNEFPRKITGQIHQMWLTQIPWADGSHEIEWSSSAGDPATVVRFYYDTDRDPAVKTTIPGQTTLAAGRFTWQTGAVPDGTYFVAMEMDDGFHPVRTVYSEVPVSVKKQVSLTFQPLANHSLPVPNDFARQAGNRWDFADATDLDSRGAPFPASGVQQLTNLTFHNGLLSARTSGSDPYLLLNMPGGARLNSAHYSLLTLRLQNRRSDGRAMQVQLVWYRGDGSTGSSTVFLAQPGWHVYQVDLAQQAGWSGQITHLRLDPDSQAGADFSLDWVRVAPAGPALPISWQFQHAPANTTTTLLLEPLAAPDQAITLADRIGGGTFNWRSGSLDGGSYRLVAQVDDHISAIQRVVYAELLQLISPDAPQLSTPNAITILALAGTAGIPGMVPISNLGGSTLAWTAHTDTSWIELENGAGQTTALGQLHFRVDSRGLILGRHTGTITVDAGVGGSQEVQVILLVVSDLQRVNLPMVAR